MPTLSASDYTTYLKFKAAAASPIKPAIQTRDNASLSQSVVNANILTSQAAFVVTPNKSPVVVQPAVVTAVSSSTITAARTDVLSAAVGDGAKITYTSSQAHGLATGDIVTITGFGTFTAANVTALAVVVTGTDSFTIAVAASGTATGNGSITGRVYYTTSVAHGLVAGDVISITGVTTFIATDKSVLSTPTATTFALSSTTTGTAVTGQTGRIVGLVYYTTNVGHGLGVGQLNVTISGITGTTAFNLSLVTLYRVPSTTTFVVQNSATGTAVTTQTGQLSVTYYANTTTSISGIARVQAVQPMRTNNPNALSTLSGSGVMSSSPVQRPGGLPTGFKGSQGTYHRIPQNAGAIQGNMISSGPKRF